MTKPINTQAIEKATGKPWSYWTEFLDGINAQELPHAEIAKRVNEHGSGGWWAQSITVAYEQHIGRREPGQDNQGEFSVSVTKTIPGDIDQALESWLHLAGNKHEFGDVSITEPGKISKSDKWRYWRAKLSDDTRIVVTIDHSSPDKSRLNVTHEKLPSALAVEHWRDYWKSFLTNLE
jgi:hypothetical protein